jgi:sigma-B regulation protein RsbU (phosphoserine phosphatase)
MPDDAQTRIAELERRLEEESGRFRRLVQVGTLLSSTLNLQELLEQILRSATELVHAESASLLLVDEQTDELRFAVLAGDAPIVLSEQRLPRGRGIAGHVLEHRVSVIVDDPAKDARFYQATDAASGFATRNLAAAPLVVRDRAIGVIEVVNRIGGAFSALDLEVVDALASLAAVAIDNSTMYANLADAVVTARLSYRL